MLRDALTKLEAAGSPVDRAGSGPVAEVYPAASLRRWGLTHSGYKQKTETDALGRLVDHLLDEAPWLDWTTHEQAMRRSHDVFDAVIAAMTARAGALGQTIQPTRDDVAAATAEGWITSRQADQRTGVSLVERAQRGR
jgi:predicted nuclease with RNAse H fold